MKPKVYLAGQPNQYDNWRAEFKALAQFVCYDPDVDSDQSSPETFFPQDLEAIRNADILVANPGLKPSEGTWIEIGYFLALHTVNPGETSKNLIIIWKPEREPRWSIKFVERTGRVVSSVEEAIQESQKLTLIKRSPHEDH